MSRYGRITEEEFAVMVKRAPVNRYVTRDIIKNDAVRGGVVGTATRRGKAIDGEAVTPVTHPRTRKRMETYSEAPQAGSNPAPSPSSQKFFIGCRLPGMNEILTAKGKPGWSKDNYTNLKLLYESMIRVDIKQAKLTPMTKPAVINFVWVEPNAKRDFDNIRAGAKFILDALVAQKILQDDTRQYVRGFTDTFHVDKTNPGVWVTLEEL